MNVHQAEEIVQKQHVLVLSGLPASGKTEEALNWYREDPSNRVRIGYAELKQAIGGKVTKEMLEEEAFRLAVEAIGAGKSICIDHTNLQFKERAKWVTLAKASGCPVEIFEINTPLEVCIERDRQRPRGERVGRAVIERTALDHGMIDWNDVDLYPRDFIIVDMDGTIADHAWRLDHIMPVCRGCHKEKKVTPEGACTTCSGKEFTVKDYTTYYRMCGDDGVIHDVLDVVKTLSQEFDVLIVTGRPADQAGIASEEWLRQHDVPVRHLFMPLKGGPGTRDMESKTAIAELLPIQRCKYSFDDRNRSVAVWRKFGVRTFQVKDGDF